MAAAAATSYLTVNVICLLTAERAMSLSPACGAITGSRNQRAVWAKHSGSPFRHALAAFTAPLKKFSAGLRHRRELEQLARFGDRELRDLAVTRNDIDFALAEPLWRDPATSFRQARSGCAGQTSKP
jgi:uncharacterized protein YjiS (DUF1127 family)